jgi:hypothetical protein
MDQLFVYGIRIKSRHVDVSRTNDVRYQLSDPHEIVDTTIVRSSASLNVNGFVD